MGVESRHIADETEVRTFFTDVMRGHYPEAKMSERIKAAEDLIKRIDVDAGLAPDEDTGYGTMYGVVILPPVAE